MTSNFERQVTRHNVSLAFPTDTRSSPYLCEILTSTEDERRRSPPGTDDKLICSILSDSRTNFVILDNGICCLTLFAKHWWLSIVVSGDGRATLKKKATP